MKLNFDYKNITHNLLYTKEVNINVAEALNNLCFDINYNFQESFKQNHFDPILVIICYLNLDEDNIENKNIINKWIRPNIVKINSDNYTNNPYYKKFKNISFANNNYKLQVLSYPKYSFFPLDEITINATDYYQEDSHIAYFENDYEYLALTSKKNIWMCITPNEINTMQKYIDEASGKVLTYGLGLGYFQYMCSLKENVKEIVVVEKDITIINLFLQNILPLFENKEKIQIINEDAFSHIANIKTEYDYIFVDIWHNPEDGLISYMKFNSIIRDKSNIHYWLEDSILAMYRRCILTVIEEQIHGSKDNNYKIAYNEMDKIINSIYFKTKGTVINSEDELIKFLGDENIKKLVKEKSA